MSKFNISSRFEFIGMREIKGKFIIQICNGTDSNSHIVLFMVGNTENTEITVLAKLSLKEAILFINTHLYLPLVDYIIDIETENTVEIKFTNNDNASLIVYKYEEKVVFWANINNNCLYKIDFDADSFIKNIGDVLNYMYSLLKNSNALPLIPGYKEPQQPLPVTEWYNKLE